MKPNKRHVRYFTKSDLLKNLGITMLAVGGIIFFVGRGVILYLTMVGLLPGGLIVFLLGTIGRSTDADINSLIVQKTTDMEVDLQNNERVRKGMLKSIDKLTTEGYEFHADSLIKKAKTAEIRSTEYCRAILYPLKDCIYMVRVHIDLLTEEEEREVLEIPYESISNISTATETVDVNAGKKIYAVKSSHLVIDRVGEEALMLPIRESAVIDQFVDHITRHMAGEL